MKNKTKKTTCLLTHLFLLLFLSACSPQLKKNNLSQNLLTCINIVDRNGLTETINNTERLEQYKNVNFLMPQPYQKVLRIYTRDIQGNIPACMTSYHPNGYPSKYLDGVNGRACGCYKEWYSNGNLKIEAFVMEGTADIIDNAEKTWIFNGICNAWTEQGELEASFPYVKGALEGEVIYYHPNGNIWKKIPYNKNQINGTLYIYTIDGGLLQTSDFIEGINEGKTIRYWDEGLVASEETCCEGFIASGKYYNKEGKLLSEISCGKGVRAIFGKDKIIQLQEYNNGQLEGFVKILDAQDRVKTLYHVKNQTKHGEEICYYDAPRFQETLFPKISINWYEGKIQGITKTWYNNQTQESQREMSHNKKNGHSTAWYKEGSLMLIEEYEQDRLIKGEYYNKGDKSPVTTVIDGKGVVTLFDSKGGVIQKTNYLNGKPLLEE